MSTTKKEHCRHCRVCPRAGANGLSAGGGPMRHSDMAGVTWMGECPRCAEADRIAAEIVKAAPTGEPDPIRAAIVAEAYLTCWTIARGET